MYEILGNQTALHMARMERDQEIQEKEYVYHQLSQDQKNLSDPTHHVRNMSQSNHMMMQGASTTNKLHTNHPIIKPLTNLVSTLQFVFFGLPGAKLVEMVYTVISCTFRTAITQNDPVFNK